MHDLPFRIAFSTFGALTSAGAVILNEETLIPLGIFCAFASVLTVAAWRMSAAVTRAADKMEHIEKRLEAVESKFNK